MSIATELQRILATKKDLRNALNIDDSVPFSQYAAHIPWHGETPPASTRFFDFVGNRYSADGFPALLSSLGITFTRLSSATQWKDGVLVDVAANVMRLDKPKGLLIEKSSTELIHNNSSLTSINTAWTATQKTDAQIGSVFEFVSDGSSAAIRTNVPVYPEGNVAADNGYYYRSVLVKKTDVDSYFFLGSSSGNVSLILNLRDGSVDTVGVSVAQHKVTLIGHYYLIESLSTETGAVERQFFLVASNNRGSFASLGAPSSGYKTTVAFPSFRGTADFPQSAIKTSGTQVTRAKETLVIPFAAGQTVTADKDEGVTMTIVDNNAVFEGQGYIRSVRVN